MAPTSVGGVGICDTSGPFPCNVAIAAIAVKWNYCIKFHEITLRPNQGDVNSINLKRIFKIGREALGDFRRINRNIKKKSS